MKRLATILALIVCQIVGALAVGFTIVDMNIGGAVAEGVYYEYVDMREATVGITGPQKVSLSGMSISEAVGVVVARYEDILDNGRARIRYGNDEFVFKFSEIQYAIDKDELTLQIEEKSKQAKSLNLLSTNLRNYTVQVVPSITINDEAFKEMLEQIKPVVEREPSNANIDIIDGKVSITPDINGVLFDVEKSFLDIKERFLNDPFGVLDLSNRSGREIELLAARIPESILVDMESVIAVASTPIMPWCDRELLQKAAESINKVFLHGVEGEGAASMTDLFSLDKYLANRWLRQSYAVEEYNQLATTLYIAILRAGITRERIYLYRQDSKADYSDLGFDVSVLGRNRDFKFDNTLNSDIIIFASVEDDLLTVRVAGKHDNVNSHEHIVSSRVLEIIEPRTIYIESSEVEMGEEEIQEEGMAGFIVGVYRDGEEIERVQYRARPRTIARSSVFPRA